MQTQLYGNYIGIVVNTQDPENRGRLQVFIPHISTTLYEAWNKEAKDIIIRLGDLTQIDAAVQEKLTRLLPWAECAMPLFGIGGTAYTDRYTNKVKLQANAPKPVINEWNKNITSEAKKVSSDVEDNSTSTTYGNAGCDENLRRFVTAIGYTESGFSVSAAEDMKDNQAVTKDLNGNVVNYVPNSGRYSQIANANIKAGIKSGLTLEQSTLKYGDFGFYRSNNQQAQQAGVGSINSGTAAQQTQNMMDYIKKRSPSAVENLCSGNFDAARQKLSGTWFGLKDAWARPQDKAVMQAIFNGGESSNAAAAQKAQNALAAAQSTTLSSRSPEEILNKSGSNSTTDTANSQKVSTPEGKTTPNSMPSRYSVLTGKHTDITSHSVPHDIREPQGINSVPTEGNLVWVFFLGGDVQKPIYFAGVKEPNATSRTDAGSAGLPNNQPSLQNYKNFNQKISSTDGSQIPLNEFDSNNPNWSNQLYQYVSDQLEGKNSPPPWQGADKDVLDLLNNDNSFIENRKLANADISEAQNLAGKLSSLRENYINQSANSSIQPEARLQNSRSEIDKTEAWLPDFSNVADRERYRKEFGDSMQTNPSSGPKTKR